MNINLMGRPLNSDGRQTRLAILDAALDLFADRGYFGTSLRDIATAVGVRESALYNYFTGKAALFEALMLVDHEHKIERLAALEEPITDIRATLERFAMLALDDFAAPRQEKLFLMLMTDGMRLAKEGRINLLERLTSGRARLHELMERLVREGWLRAADPAWLAIAFIGPLLLWRQLHAIDPTLPAITNRKAFARGHVRQFLHGATAVPLARHGGPLRKRGRPSSGDVPRDVKGIFMDRVSAPRRTRS